MAPSQPETGDDDEQLFDVMVRASYSERFDYETDSAAAAEEYAEWVITDDIREGHLDGALDIEATARPVDSPPREFHPDPDVVNYVDIFESLDLILQEEAPHARERILDSLNDAVGNNADHLRFEEGE